MRSLVTRISIAALMVGSGAGAVVGATINVPADQPTIQAGINAAVSGADEVVVAVGTYNELIDLLGKAITVRSSDPANPAVVAATIIDGTGLGDSVVKCNNGETSATVLAGLTITGGNGVLGGGMNNVGSSKGGLTSRRRSTRLRGSRWSIAATFRAGGPEAEGISSTWIRCLWTRTGRITPLADAAVVFDTLEPAIR